MNYSLTDRKRFLRRLRRKPKEHPRAVWQRKKEALEACGGRAWAIWLEYMEWPRKDKPLPPQLALELRLAWVYSEAALAIKPIGRTGWTFSKIPFANEKPIGDAFSVPLLISDFRIIGLYEEEK